MSYLKIEESKRQYVEVAGQFRAVRHKRKLTQAALAKRTGVSQSVIANLEAGNGNPTLRTLISLAIELGVEMTLYPF